ncbi:OmpA family protein [Parasulfuritortus cantonensis]|uniref:OmpA family protein n=1 Tax=Parasulfuritortus cantonensis TaxID=2528202 RepID=A0A4R1B5L6_9PROT|nr:OmpA family protein [Parasulfuritortus cantonensis]TCJ11797.1 OmpA family protein [Parasulfuritortus cantonensis]
MPTSCPTLSARLRALLVTALYGLAVPALAGTEVVVLQNPLPSEVPEDNRAQIHNADGVYGIPAAGFGGQVERGFITVPRVSDDRIQSDFGAALAAMHEILQQGLPPLSHSYVVLLAPEAGQAAGYLGVSVGERSYRLEEPGRAMLMDGYSYAPFTATPGQITGDFGTLLTTLAEAKQAGLPTRTYVVLLENPDGKTGKIMVTDAHGTTVLDQNLEALRMDPGNYATFEAGAEQVRQDFGAALDARPPLPSHVTLFFETGSTKLNADSEQALAALLADLHDRPLPELTLQGHTDTVGTEKFNDKLAQKRADYVAKRIRAAYAGIEHLEVESFGQRQLLVQTPPETAEVKNRRVEVYLR